MKSSILKNLESIIQGEIFYKKEFREFYSVDASSYQIIPKIIVIPRNEKDIISTIKIAKKFRTSVTVRGAGTGLVGSALNNGIVLDLKKLDSIRFTKKHVIVGAGVLKGRLDKKLEKTDKFFPPNPSIGNFCSIGGMLGNNSGGSRSLKYGSMIDNVLEITLIDGNGNKIIIQKNKKKGKEISKIIKIDESKIPKTAKNSIQINKTAPSAIEFVDENTLKQIKFKFTKKTKCLLYVEYDEKIKENEKVLKSIVSGKIIQKLDKKSDMDRWWRHRDSALHYSLRLIPKEKRIPHVIEDASGPLENIPKLFSILSKIEKKYKIRSIMYGHMGNGNIHIRLVSDRKNIKFIKNIATQYFDEIIKMSGTISAEHGDGLARSEFVKKQYGVTNYQTFKRIKKYMDPNGVLNPGKIITRKSTIVKNLEKF